MKIRKMFHNLFIIVKTGHFKEIYKIKWHYNQCPHFCTFCDFVDICYTNFESEEK